MARVKTELAKMPKSLCVQTGANCSKSAHSERIYAYKKSGLHPHRGRRSWWPSSGFSRRLPCPATPSTSGAATAPKRAGLLQAAQWLERAATPALIRSRRHFLYQLANRARWPLRHPRWPPADGAATLTATPKAHKWATNAATTPSTKRVCAVPRTLPPATSSQSAGTNNQCSTIRAQ